VETPDQPAINTAHRRNTEHEDQLRQPRSYTVDPGSGVRSSAQQEKSSQQTGPVDHDRLLTITEAPGLLRIPVATLRGYRHPGIGPLSFKLGRHVMYGEADVFSWVDAQAEAAKQHRAG
jgi:hypothetical protein